MKHVGARGGGVACGRRRPGRFVVIGPHWCRAGRAGRLTSTSVAAPPGSGARRLRTARRRGLAHGLTRGRGTVRPHTRGCRPAAGAFQGRRRTATEAATSAPGPPGPLGLRKPLRPGRALPLVGVRRGSSGARARGAAGAGGGKGRGMGGGLSLRAFHRWSGAGRVPRRRGGGCPRGGHFPAARRGLPRARRGCADVPGRYAGPLPGVLSSAGKGALALLRRYAGRPGADGQAPGGDAGR